MSIFLEPFISVRIHYAGSSVSLKNMLISSYWRLKSRNFLPVQVYHTSYIRW